jgi:hypothetical protein
MVNIKSAYIFNGVFETQKSTRNGKNNAKIRALATWRPRVYHAGIYHDGALYRLPENRPASSCCVMTPQGPEPGAAGRPGSASRSAFDASTALTILRMGKEDIR